MGGSLAVMASALILTQLTARTSFDVLVVSYVLFGAGIGLINPPITNTAVSGMPPSQAGVAAAVASTGRQVGSTLGVAVLGSLAAGGPERHRSRLHRGDPRELVDRRRARAP